jgi:hypothetical protein
MSETPHLTVNDRRIVHETIEGETILIDLETGTYFSLAGSGSEIWGLLMSGHSVREVIDEMTRRYPSEDQVASLTAELIERLHQEGLLTEEEVNSASRPDPSVQAPAAVAAFVPPVLEGYTDMQHFLMLDPIHEVHGDGWPRPPEPDQETVWPRAEAAQDGR